MTTTRNEITELLIRSRQGDETARTALFERLYEPLREIAHGQLRRGGPATLDTTELVHEVYLKLLDANRLSVADRGHFFAVSARAMRQILVDRFRKRGASKRGGAVEDLPFREGQVPVGDRGRILLALDDALEVLMEMDRRAGRIVELKFFGGMTEPEIADALDVSVRTVSGDWRKARAWLARELEAS